jgi:hypothetical protein
MGTSSLLATLLDQEMLENRGTVSILPAPTPDAMVPAKNGNDVFEELGGRFLLRYVVPAQLAVFGSGSRGVHWVTPTPYQPEETISWLALPALSEPRRHALILDPREIEVICGPRWVRLGCGIEYILPHGFPERALVLPWPIEVT